MWKTTDSICQICANLQLGKLFDPEKLIKKIQDSFHYLVPISKQIRLSDWFQLQADYFFDKTNVESTQILSKNVNYANNGHLFEINR